MNIRKQLDEIIKNEQEGKLLTVLRNINHNIKMLESLLIEITVNKATKNYIKVNLPLLKEAKKILEELTPNDPTKGMGRTFVSDNPTDEFYRRD
jgi:hypothetical protein